MGKVAQKLRNTVTDWIEDLEELDPDETTLKEVTKLKILLGEVDGKKTYEKNQSVLQAFIKGLVWIGKKVTRCFKKWFSTNAEENIFGAIGAAISTVFNVALGVAVSAIKLVFNVVLFIGSYALGAIIKAIAFVADTIKGWALKAKEKFIKKDEEEDFFEEEDFDI